jgi:hypothetical protein
METMTASGSDLALDDHGGNQGQRAEESEKNEFHLQNPYLNQSIESCCSAARAR